MPPNGIGDCKKCKDGDWECFDGACEGGGGEKPPYEKLGRIWLPIDNGRDGACEIYARAVFERDDDGKVLFADVEKKNPKFHLEVKVSPQFKIRPDFAVQLAEPLPEYMAQKWLDVMVQKEMLERRLTELLGKS